MSRSAFRKVTTGLRGHVSIVSLALVAAAGSVAGSANADTGAASPDKGAGIEEVIVTGTREQGHHARDSATPIDVVDRNVLDATGAGNVLDALKDVLPSVNAPAVGYDVGALARVFQLRGLSPSHTLVLVNGKRRHLSSSIYSDSDPAQGSNAVDLDLIPLNAVSRIEVLRDGASAQYGSDAIAGVINVILNDDGDGGDVSLQSGAYYKGDGFTLQGDADDGFPIGNDGRLHVSAGYRYHDFSNRSGDSGGVQPAKVQGDPRSNLLTGGYDYTQDLGGDFTVYSFATAAYRRARANENPRQPGWFSPAVDALYPDGFTPQETLSEHDFSVTGGVRRSGIWNIDLSTTYGQDIVALDNINTVNPDLLADTGNAQTAFNVGGFSSSEWTSNLDVRRDFNVGLAEPLSLAFGIEDRDETYGIKAGEPNSYYLGGPQAFPGFRPSDTVHASRNGVAEYVDVTLHPVSRWDVSAAGRAEQYDGFAGRINGKLSTRYEVSPAFALRASASTGFHVPSLEQEYYSATSVTTGYASIQLPLGSPGADLLGAPALRPETSRSYSAGFVAAPLEALTVTADVYNIDVDNRIIESAYLYGPLAEAAVAANGSVIPAGLSPDNVAAVFFTNGVDTRTQGLDVTARYRTALDAWGDILWDADLGYVETTIRNVHAAPAVLAAAGATLVDGVQTTNLTTATPKYKATLAASWNLGPWSATLRNTFYGDSKQAQGYGAPYYIITTGGHLITDLDVGYQVSERVRLNVGANNLFDVYPRRIDPSIYQNLNFDQYSHVAPFGIDGGFYYLRVSVAL
jgi:iron complex outermembrane receptor protein